MAQPFSYEMPARVAGRLRRLEANLREKIQSDLTGTRLGECENVQAKRGLLRSSQVSQRASRRNVPMPVFQENISVRTNGRGLHDVTSEVAAIIRRSKLTIGVVVVFCQHTSCSLVIMENADPTARSDLEAYFERIAPDGDPRYAHDAEGPDDMSAHLRVALTRTSETIPFTDGQLALGTWQGLYLWEHRTSRHRRSLVVSVQGGS